MVNKTTEALDAIAGRRAHAASGDLVESEYLITKGGYYYRPKAAGYTTCKHEAGRFTLEDAIAYSHPNGPDGPRDGIRYEPAPPMPEDTPGHPDVVEAVARALFAHIEDEVTFSEAKRADDMGYNWVKDMAIDAIAVARPMIEREIELWLRSINTPELPRDSGDAGIMTARDFQIADAIEAGEHRKDRP